MWMMWNGVSPIRYFTKAYMQQQLTWSRHSPLDPANFQILKAQYEKEGQYAGIQTKFNYAWV